MDTAFTTSSDDALQNPGGFDPDNAAPDPREGIGSDKEPQDQDLLALQYDERLLTPEGDAERLMRSCADQLMIASFTDRRGRVCYDLYTLQPTGIWQRSDAAAGLLLSDVSRDWSRRAIDNLPAGRAKTVVTYLKNNARVSHQKQVIAQVPLVRLRWQQDRDPDFHRLTVNSIEDLDADGRYLGCANGVMDLATGTLLTQHQARRVLVTRTTEINFRPHATHWAVEALLSHLDDETRECLLAVLGRMLWAQPNRVFIVIIGPTGGGKTTLLLAVHAALGLEAEALSANALRPNRGQRTGPTPELHGLVEARVVFATECEGWNIDRAQLKNLTGGEIVPYQPKYLGERKRRVRATIVLTGNALPELGLYDPAVVDRMRLIPYSKPEGDVFASQEGAAAEAMLSLLVQYAVKYPPGVPIPTSPAMTDVMDQAIADECGLLGPWLADQVVPDPTGRVTMDDVWRTWARYMDHSPTDSEIDGITRQQAVAAFRMRYGVGAAKPIRTGRTINRGWAGFRLRDPEELPAVAETPAGPAPEDMSRHESPDQRKEHRNDSAPIPNVDGANLVSIGGRPGPAGSAPEEAPSDDDGPIQLSFN